MVRNNFVQLLPPLALLFFRHGESLVKCVGAFSVVPRVHRYLGTIKHRSTPGEFAENERSMFLILTTDELMACQVHAIAKAGHDESIGDSKECKILRIANVLVKVYDWLVIQGGMRAINASYNVDNG